jgi:hypothetical protein
MILLWKRLFDKNYGDAGSQQVDAAHYLAGGSSMFVEAELGRRTLEIT